MPDPLRAALESLAAAAAGPGSGAPQSLSTRDDAPVVRVGDVVAKAHPAGTDPELLAVRLRLAAALPELWLAPLVVDGRTCTEAAGRLVTLWPVGVPVDPDDPDAAPWTAVAGLLARLHRTPGAAVPVRLPPQGAPGRVARAYRRLRDEAADHPAAQAVRAAYASLPGWAYGDAPAPAGRLRTVAHGDFHLGQLVRLPDRGWRLVDVDDLGYGDPLWDLARPAAWHATGMLAPDVWSGFVEAYRGYGGPALPGAGDPWHSEVAPVLDTVAGALVAQTAALAVVAAVREARPLDEIDQVLVETCRRFASR